MRQHLQMPYVVVDVKFEAVFINVKATIRLERSFSLCAFHQNCLLCSGAGLTYVLNRIDHGPVTYMP